MGHLSVASGSKQGGQSTEVILPSFGGTKDEEHDVHAEPKTYLENIKNHALDRDNVPGGGRLEVWKFVRGAGEEAPRLARDEEWGVCRREVEWVVGCQPKVGKLGGL